MSICKIISLFALISLCESNTVLKALYKTIALLNTPVLNVIALYQNLLRPPPPPPPPVIHQTKTSVHWRQAPCWNWAPKMYYCWPLVALLASVYGGGLAACVASVAPAITPCNTTPTKDINRRRNRDEWWKKRVLERNVTMDAAMCCRNQEQIETEKKWESNGEMSLAHTV